jgi:hypothetical protein
MAKKKKESFIATQIVRYILCGIVFVIGLQIHTVYGALLAQWQTTAAANQLEDSITSWMLHQQMSYGVIIPYTIIFITSIIIIFILLPTFKHILSKVK